MNIAFGSDLSHVRIHDDAAAADLSRRVSADAFTTGSDVFFRAGGYAPRTPAGERVLAHELAHTLQADQAARRATLRRAPWGGEGLTQADAKRDVYIGEDQKLTATVFLLPDAGNHPTKAAAAWALVGQLSGVTLPPKAKFTKAAAMMSFLKPDGTRKENLSVQQLNTYKNIVDPFMIKGTATYGPGNSVLELYWQFSMASYGYVTAITQNGRTLDMHPKRGNAEVAEAMSEEKDPLRKAQWEALMKGDLDADAITSFYGSAHDTTHSDEPIASHANRELVGISDLGLSREGQLEQDAVVTTARGRLRQDHQTLDAVAKIAGEGPRFTCLRKIPDTLRDNSRFYISEDGNTLSVTLKVLWGAWGTVFNSAWNIKDSVVIKALKDGKLKSVSQPDGAFKATEHDCQLVPGGA